MQPTDRAAFLEVVVGFAELKGKQLSAPALELFWNAMQGWTIGSFRSAASQLIRTCEFMPTPKDFEDIRRAASTETAAEAWFTSGKTDDPLAARAMHIAAQGRYVGHIPMDELQWVQKRFIEVYDELRDVTEIRQALPEIAGPNRLALAAATNGLLQKF
jgi:hypothetical protein